MLREPTPVQRTNAERLNNFFVKAEERMFRCIPETLTEEQMEAIGKEIEKLDFIESVVVDGNKSISVTYTHYGSWVDREVDDAQMKNIEAIVAKHGGTLEANCI